MTESYSEPCQISTMDCFAKIVNSWKTIAIFFVWQVSEYDSECHHSDETYRHEQQKHWTWGFSPWNFQGPDKFFERGS